MISGLPPKNDKYLNYSLKVTSGIKLEDLTLKVAEFSFSIQENYTKNSWLTGVIDLKDLPTEKALQLEICGSSPDNKQNVDGIITLSHKGIGIGNFRIMGLVEREVFNCLICHFILRFNPVIISEIINRSFSHIKNAGFQYYPQLVTCNNTNEKFQLDSIINIKQGEIADYKVLESSQTHNDEILPANSSNENIEIGNYDLFLVPASRPQVDSGGQVSVFYGTNRNRLIAEEKKKFGNELDKMEQGYCIISIPPGHKQGALERPARFLWWQKSEKQEKHIVLNSINPLSENDFYSRLKESLIRSESKMAMIFIHGFNTSFEEAARRCGQITYDIPFSGITGFFSWPSSGRVTDYARDVERAEASISNLASFIENVVIKTGVKELHFIAHSMGNRILTRSLNNLFQKESFKQKISIISQIVLAAPDIDTDVFNNEIYPTFKKIGKRRTIYASDQDMALHFSEKLHKNLRRVGEGGANIYVADGLDTIDASNVRSKGIHHSYIFEESELLYDLNMLFLNGSEPQKRRLMEKSKTIDNNSLKYWLFRK